jgi:hypothetical protein
MPRRPASVLALALAAGLSLLTGCAGLGYLANAATGGNKVPAKHTLKPKPTLIMVDDPDRRLAQPTMVSQIAANARFHLRQNTALTEPLLSPTDQLPRVRRDLGNDYHATPIATVGQQVGAEQVVHVLIRSVDLQYGGPVYRPQAACEVKVIETQTGKRLFPEDQSQIEGLSPRGYVVRSKLPSRHGDDTVRGARTIMARKLARRIGRDVARLFYRHEARPTAKNLKEHN